MISFIIVSVYKCYEPSRYGLILKGKILANKICIPDLPRLKIN